jgi:hypothetical protein
MAGFMPGPGAGGPPPAPPGPPGPQPPPPAPAPPAGISPPPKPPLAQLTASLMIDLPSEIPAGWQLVDAACRQLKLAIKHPTFAKTPKTVAVLYDCVETMTKLLSHYTQKGDSGGAPTSTAEPSQSGDNMDAHFTASDVAAEPAPDSGS